jgi:hypothetical protein
MLFVDDTNILVSEGNINKLQYKINRVMNELQTRYKLNNLVVNAENTLAIPFHTFQNKKPVFPRIILERRDVPYNIETKFLGIYINKNIKWNSHIKYLSSKLSTICYMINSLQNVMSPYILRTMYFACFHVHLRYGLTLWGGDPESIWIFRLQKMEKLLSRNKEAYTAFLDLQAAFDTIPRQQIWIALQKLGVTKNLVQKIQSIYETVKGRVRIGGEQSEKIIMEKGVKQGDSLSPLLFMTVMDQILKQCKRRTARCKVGNYKMGSVYVQSLIYADDIVLIVSNENYRRWKQNGQVQLTIDE